MKTTNIGLAEWRLTANPDEKLVAIGIGSCVAVVLVDLEQHLGALAHIMLPNGPTSEPVPGKFVNVMIPLLVKEMRENGAESMRAGVFGGATLLGSGQSLLLDIGRRNIEAATQQLTALGIAPALADTGGTRGRTVELAVGSGRVTVKILGQPDTQFDELATPSEAAS